LTKDNFCSFQNWTAKPRTCRWCRPSTRRTLRRWTQRRGWPSAPVLASSSSFSSFGTSSCYEHLPFGGTETALNGKKLLTSNVSETETARLEIKLLRFQDFFF